MTVFHLDQLQHAETGSGPWRLYVYTADGQFHTPDVWFSCEEQRPPGVAAALEASLRCDRAQKQGREVRVTDSGDMLVFHAKGDQILYGENFWKEALAR